MRLLSYTIDRRQRYGMIDQSGYAVIDLTDRIYGARDLGELVRTGRLDDARDFTDAPPDHQVNEIMFDRLLDWPGKVFCIGANYAGTGVENGDGSSDPYHRGAGARDVNGYPHVSVRFPDSFAGHERPLLRPPESWHLDYEGEIVLVIGLDGRRIPMNRAHDHIAGLTLGNDGTIGDWLDHVPPYMTQAKNWESSGSLGPWMVNTDEIGDLGTLELTTSVNGEVRQHASTASMKFSIEYIVHYLSTFTTLRAGDVIFTGSPAGAGAQLDPPKWLQTGDVIEISVPEIGTLRNTVTDEFPDGPMFVAPEPRSTVDPAGSEQPAATPLD